MEKIKKASEFIGKALNCLVEARDEINSLYDAAEYQENVNAMDTLDDAHTDLEDNVGYLESVGSVLERINADVDEVKEALS